MGNYIQAIDGFYTNDVYYTDTDSLYIENKLSKELGKAGLVGKNRIKEKNDYKEGGMVFIWYGLFLAAKRKFCLLLNRFGNNDEHKTFKCFTNVSDSLDRKKFSKMADGGKLIAEVQLSWKKSFSQGVVISQKMRNCGECKKDILCESCEQLVNQKKEFSANLNELNRQPPNEIICFLNIKHY